MSDLEFVDIELIQPPQQEVDKEISTDDGEITAKRVSRASGVSKDKAVDLAFYPNVAPPKMVGRAKKLFPVIARDNDVEAVVHTEVMIDAEGVVRNVNVMHVRFSKEVSEDIKAEMRRAFIRDTKNIIMSARFTPAVINGEKKAVLMQYPVTFELE
jgi:outer membrane biosynthesis protein TonB